MTTIMHSHNHNYNKKGFTMIELVVVVLIIGVLFTFLAPKFFGKSKETKISVAKLELKNLASTIKMFQLKIGQYPENLEDLVSKPRNEKLAQKWSGPFLDFLPEDPWNNPYVYKRTKGAAHPYELYTEGPEDDETTGKISVWDLK